jgi:hypothetical protein
VRCKQHPRYAARQHPAKTAAFPDGCPTCWGAWEAAKSDKKRQARTVILELPIEEARVVVVALNRAPHPDPVVQRFAQMLAVATKEAL